MRSRTTFELGKYVVRPAIVKPSRPLELGPDFFNDRIRSRLRCAAMHRTAQLVTKRTLYGQRERSIGRFQIQDRRQGLPQIQIRAFHPDGMNVRADQVTVPQIDTGRRHRSGDHPGGFAVEVLIMRAAPCAVREHQGGLSAAACASATLCVIGRRRRHVAQVDEVELGDIDAELHRRGAERSGSFPSRKRSSRSCRSREVTWAVCSRASRTHCRSTNPR